MVSFDSLSFSVRHRGRFVGFAQDEFCFFCSEFTASGRVLPMFGAVDCLFSTLGSCRSTRRQGASDFSSTALRSWCFLLGLDF